LHAGHAVVDIHRARREVRAADGTVAPYDRLLLATGSNPFILPIPGNDLPGVIGFRDIQDVETMLAAARTGKNAVVIGGGLLGLEAANGLMKQGMQVTVVHVLDTLMERQLDPVAADMLRRTWKNAVCAS
jgi:nitrite reductase (NADH) large subunit